MRKSLFEYKVVKPDQSEIDIHKGYHEVVGKFVWNDFNEYSYLGITAINQDQLTEILESLKMLNKRSNLPKWLQWGTQKK